MTFGAIKKPAVGSGKNSAVRRSVRLPARWFYRTILRLIQVPMILLFGLKIQRDPALKKIDGPLIVLGNHPSYLDPFLAALALPWLEINFVAASSFFRRPLMARFLHLGGVIPKTQFRSDARALKMMLQVLRSGGVLGVFPEGQRSLNGSVQPLDDTIARLIKKIGCPVVIVHISGAYLTWPRWSASGFRPGRIEVQASLLFNHSDVESKDADEMARRIRQALSYNDYDWQLSRRRLAGFFSLAPARGLHSVCHQCPYCGSTMSMESRNFHMICQRCHADYRINRFGFIELRKVPRTDSHAVRVDPPLSSPTTVYEWQEWQRESLAAAMRRTGFRLNIPVKAYTSDLTGRFEYVGDGMLVLDRTTLHYNGVSPQGNIVNDQQPVRYLQSFSADFGERIEIAHDNGFWRFEPQQGQAVMVLADSLRLQSQLDKESSDQ